MLGLGFWSFWVRGLAVADVCNLKTPSSQGYLLTLGDGEPGPPLHLPFGEGLRQRISDKVFKEGGLQGLQVFNFRVSKVP